MRGKPSSFHVAEMRDLIDLQREDVQMSDSGQPVRSWVDTHTQQPAKYYPVAGSEYIRGRQVEAGITVVFTIRTKADVVPEMRVVHKSGIYGITYVKPVDGMPIYSELHCKAVV